MDTEVRQQISSQSARTATMDTDLPVIGFDTLDQRINDLRIRVVQVEYNNKEMHESFSIFLQACFGHIDETFKAIEEHFKKLGVAVTFPEQDVDSFVVPSPPNPSDLVSSSVATAALRSPSTEVARPQKRQLPQSASSIVEQPSPSTEVARRQKRQLPQSASSIVEQPSPSTEVAPPKQLSNSMATIATALEQSSFLRTMSQKHAATTSMIMSQPEPEPQSQSQPQPQLQRGHAIRPQRRHAIRPYPRVPGEEKPPEPQSQPEPEPEPEPQSQPEPEPQSQPVIYSIGKQLSETQLVQVQREQNDYFRKRHLSKCSVLNE